MTWWLLVLFLVGGWTAEVSPPVELGRTEITLGHCFVEPVVFDDEVWNVPYDRQFGWGGMQPDGWSGTGVMTRIAPGRARFTDDAGAVVTFRPVGHPSVVPVESAGCD